MEHRRYEDDRSLVAGCLRRDAGAWASFVGRYSDLMLAAAKNRLKRCGLRLPSEDLKDIRQDVLELLWKTGKLEDVRDHKDIASWLAVVSGNAAIDYMRKRRRVNPDAAACAGCDVPEEGMDDMARYSGPDPGGLAIDGELAQRLDEAIGGLPDAERLVIKLNLIYGKKYHEIAEITRMPSGTVSNYISRAKARLRKRLKDYEK